MKNMNVNGENLNVVKNLAIAKKHRSVKKSAGTQDGAFRYGRGTYQIPVFYDDCGFGSDDNGVYINGPYLYVA